MPVEWRGVPPRLLRETARQAVAEAARHVLGESNRLVPFREGHLARSGRVTTQAQSDKISGIVSYHSPYALRQHEETSWRHPHGRQAKYLETALIRNRGEVLQILARRMRGLLG